MNRDSQTEKEMEIKLEKVQIMRFIEKRKFGQDGDVEVPVFVINKAELKILKALITKARYYLPNLIVPDMARLNNIKKTIDDYLRESD